MVATDAVTKPKAPSKRKSKQPVKFKKAPQAPRRFKSAYMFFSTAKHPEIRARLKEEGILSEKTTKIAKMVSEEWKGLSAEDREKWEAMAREDKARFEMEKTMYTGPWKVPAKKRSHKDPDAPKRPMSAFLSFSNSKRAEIRRENPHCSNAEISRILAQLWKDASDEERKEHIDQEYKLRQEYKVAIAEWRKNSENELQAQRNEREEVARKAAANREQMGPPAQSQHPMHGGYDDTGNPNYYGGGDYYPPQGPPYSQEGPPQSYQDYPSQGQYGGSYYNYPPQYGYGYDGANSYYGNSSYGGGYSYYSSQYGYNGSYDGGYEGGPPPESHPSSSDGPPVEGSHMAPTGASAAPAMYDYA